MVTLAGYKIFFPSDRPFQLVWICFLIFKPCDNAVPWKTVSPGLNWENKTYKPKGLLNDNNNNNNNNNNDNDNDNLMIKKIQ